MKIAILSVLVVSCTCTPRRFPEGFLFGAATSSYQIEGAWNASGKVESNWDHLLHTIPNIVKDRSNADISADSYHNYKRDVEMMRELGLDAYRFSLSWPRILPDEINEEGVTFYNNYINEMLKYNIEPIITLYHWDLPQSLLDLGGFLNPKFPDWFESFARVAFEKFGDRVKRWITFNEPSEVCYPGISFPVTNVTGRFACARNLLLAHSRAYHLYNEEFRTHGGECGITISVVWFEALRDTEEDRNAAELMRQYQWGLYAEPIFSQEGGFPKEISKAVAKKNLKLELPPLTQFTDDEKVYVRGTTDFFGLNHYTARLVYATKKDPPSLDTGFYVPADWPKAASSWLRQAPHSLSKTLIHLHNKYNTTFLITESGWSTAPTSSEDDDRIAYYRAALEDVLDCLDAGVDIQGYMAWSLMDNFEWVNGYTERFGLYEVDFTSPERTRTPRNSAFIYKEVLRSRIIDHHYEPSSRTMLIDEGH